ncbi:MAG: TPM domain-containing protein [Clostridia bacterium]|nr:TPM domain-containing protein [Clostridia bacterium]
MKKIIILLSLLLILCIPALADQSRVIDEADVLTADEEFRLEQAIALIGQEHQFDVVLLTKTSIDGKVPRYYAADYYDYGGFGYGDTHDGIIILLVTGAGVGDRDYTIVMTGRGETIFNDDVVYDIEDDILPDLRMSNYSSAMARFVTDVNARLADYTPARRTAKVAPILLIVGLGIGAIVAFALKAQMKSVHRKHGAANYVRDGSFQLTRVQDIYLYTTTTRRKIETQSSGGGHSGGGGFTGSSGTHHTSHSGKF